MIRLAIDTSIRPASLALQAPQVQRVKILPPHQAGAEHLVSEISSFIKQAGYDFCDIDKILTIGGPGPYIGLRVGLAAVKGICFAMKLPSLSTSSLKVLASFVQASPNELICAFLPARQGFSVFGFFDHHFTPKTDLAILEDEAFSRLAQAQKNIRLAPTPDNISKPMAQRLLELDESKMTKGVKAIYPPVSPANTQSQATIEAHIDG